MGILADLDLDNVPELVVVPEGEYELRIVEAGDHISKTTGQNMVRLVLVVESEPNAENIYHYISLPQVEDDERKRNGKLRRIRDFLAAFGLPQQSEYSEWVGATGWALVGSEVNERTGEPVNSIKRFIVSK